MKRINFFNTFEITVPVWNRLFPYLEKENIQPYAILASGKYRQEKQSVIGDYVRSVWVPSLIRNKKIANHIFYILLSPFYLLFNKADLNVFYTQPPFAMPYLAFLSRITGTPYIVHIMDYHPDLLVIAGHSALKHLVYRVLDRWNVSALKNAKKVIVLGECMKQLFVEKGIPGENMAVIQNFSSIEESIPVEQDKINALKEKYNASNKLLILYAGNMGLAHEFRTILNMAEKFEDTVQFLFAGEGIRRIEVEQYIESKGGNNVSLTGYLGDEDFEIHMQAADMHFISLRDGFEGIMVPSKLYSSLSIGRPVLFEGSKLSEVAQVLEKYTCGLFVSNLDQACMRDRLQAAVDNSAGVHELGENAKQCYDANYHSSIFCKKYLEVIQEGTNK